MNGRLGTGEEGRHYKSFLWDLCVCIHFYEQVFPIKIIVFTFQRKALLAMCDEGQDSGSGSRGVVRSRAARTQGLSGSRGDGPGTIPSSLRTWGTTV